MNGVIFIGLQASGKSSFYKEKFFKSHLRINLDMLKKRKRERFLFEACLKSSTSVVVDNTNPSKEDREYYLSLFKENHYKTIGYYFSSQFDDCFTRNNQREGKEKIPEVGMKATAKKLELPCFSEGFDELYFVSIENGSFVIKEWEK